ncbi:unnamed protein product [Colletotrichum noveboracense]|uniref:Heterokaryon incompatibility domain-containing protein n=1 Tax=Colletotrichum noveboracense TaxID=2664923 RepID=A0A9W4W9X9_9PEZI|nr:unnamed protein product [Colletotrichum noveboracense]
MVPTLTLCEHCSLIVYDDKLRDAPGNPGSPTPWWRTDTYPDLPLLLASASAGCTFCNLVHYLLRERLPMPETQALQTSATKEVTVRLDSPAYTMRSEIVDYTRDLHPDDYYNERDGLYWLQLVFKSPAWTEDWFASTLVYQQDDAVSELLGINLHIPALQVLDPACIGLLRESVETCMNEHLECQPSTNRTLPTRLIDVGKINDKSARLIIGHKLPLLTPYIALSYCWGPPSQTTSQLITTKATMPDHQKCIELGRMPNTIRDAVLFTREMGMRYVWVDALCIVQDDADDWAKEAALMYSVYRHATITVVAAAGDTCHSGFLSRKTAGPNAVIPFKSRKKGTQVSGSYMLSHMRERRTWDADYPSHLHKRAWATRAWTYQEDIMSTRVLYFDDLTSFFRCQKERRLEHSITVYNNVLEWNKLLTPHPPNLSFDEKAERNASLYQRWDDLINEYSQRSLTVADDKFPAVSGLARTFAVALDEQYVAGLWRRDLVRGMLWWTEFDVSKPTKWRAPSWSWASWDAKLGLTPQYSRPLASQCAIEEVYVEPVGIDPYGKLRNAWIVLSAVCVPVTMRQVKQASRPRETYLTEIFISNGPEPAGLGSFDAIAASGLMNDGSWKNADVGPFVALTGDWIYITAFDASYFCSFQG